MTNTIHNQQVDKQRFIDPVCGMSTENEAAFSKHEYKGTTYYFCSDNCLTKFTENPSAYGARETSGCCHSAQTETDHSTCCCHGN